MPYIPQERRDELDLQALQDIDIHNPGELNYAITVLVRQYWLRGGRYQQINDILGALAGAGMEFYARVARGYEDITIKEAGDVYY